MALYSASDLKKQLNSGGKKDIHEFAPKVNKMYNLWIPRDSFFFLKKHFNLDMVPACDTKMKAITCINSDQEAKAQKCVICEYIDTLWAKWRDTKKATDKKKITDEINRLSAQFVYVNAIDMNDPNKEFIALRLTTSLLETIAIATENTPIENIIWQYKKTEKNKRISYIMLEDTDNPKVDAMISQYDVLASREFADGGLNDLEEAFTYPTTEAKYHKLLTGEELADDEATPEDDKPADIQSTVELEDDDADGVDLDELDLDDDSDADKKAEKAEKAKEAKAKEAKEAKAKEAKEDADKAKAKKAKEAKEAKEKKMSMDVNLEDDDPELEDDDADGDGLSDVDNLDLDDDTDDDTTTTTTETASDDDDLDNLDLDELDLEDDVPEVKMIEVDCKMLNAKQKAKDTELVNKVFVALIQLGHIEDAKDYSKNLKSAYAYLKKNDCSACIPE